MMTNHERFQNETCEHQREDGSKQHAFGCARCSGCGRTIAFVFMLLWLGSFCSDCYETKKRAAI